MEENFKKRQAAYEKERIKAEMILQAKQKKARRWAFILSLISFPKLLIVYSYLAIQHRLFKTPSTTKARALLKSYFKSFFYYSGVITTEIFSTKIIKKSSLIFTVRNSPITSAYLLTQLPEHSVIPYQVAYSHYPLNRYIPFLKLGPLVTSMGYLDKPLTQSIDDIKRYLDEGKSVLVYLNPGVINHRHHKELLVYKDILELLNLSIDCYFMRCKNLEIYNLASLFSPKAVFTQCHSKDDLLEFIPNTAEGIALAIKEFYDFKSINYCE